jgi:hypothetical protein
VLGSVVVPDDRRITCSGTIERLLRIEWVTVLLSSVHFGPWLAPGSHPRHGWLLVTSLNQYRALTAHARVGRALMVRGYTLLCYF